MLVVKLPSMHKLVSAENVSYVVLAETAVLSDLQAGMNAFMYTLPHDFWLFPQASGSAAAAVITLCVLSLQIQAAWPQESLWHNNLL